LGRNLLGRAIAREMVERGIASQDPWPSGSQPVSFSPTSRRQSAGAKAPAAKRHSRRARACCSRGRSREERRSVGTSWRDCRSRDNRRMSPFARRCSKANAHAAAARSVQKAALVEKETAHRLLCSQRRRAHRSRAVGGARSGMRSQSESPWGSTLLAVRARGLNRLQKLKSSVRPFDARGDEPSGPAKGLAKVRVQVSKRRPAAVLVSRSRVVTRRWGSTRRRQSRGIETVDVGTSKPLAPSVLFGGRRLGVG